MLDKKTILASIGEPMQRYQQRILREIPDWQPLEDAAELLLQRK
jgi:hypothetical protein